MLPLDFRREPKSRGGPVAQAASMSSDDPTPAGAPREAARREGAVPGPAPGARLRHPTRAALRRQIPAPPPGDTARRLRRTGVPGGLRSPSVVPPRRDRQRAGAHRARLRPHGLAPAVRPHLRARLPAVHRRRHALRGGRRPVPRPPGPRHLRPGLRRLRRRDGAPRHTRRRASRAALPGGRRSRPSSPGHGRRPSPTSSGRATSTSWPLTAASGLAERRARRLRGRRAAAHRALPARGDHRHRGDVPLLGCAAAPRHPGPARPHRRGAGGTLLRESLAGARAVLGDRGSGGCSCSSGCRPSSWSPRRPSPLRTRPGSAPVRPSSDC